MVDHLHQQLRCNWNNHNQWSGTRLPLMELNIEMSCMNISESDSEIKNNTPNPEVSGENVDLNNTTQQEKKSNQKRLLRKRIRPVDYTKERIEIAPKIQRPNKMPLSQADIEKYYLCKTTKRLHTALETIYEEPKSSYYKPKRKLRRTIQFDQDSILSSKLKLKKRLMRAKQLPSSNNFLNRKKLSMETLLKKLSKIESDTE